MSHPGAPHDEYLFFIYSPFYSWGNWVLSWGLHKMMDESTKALTPLPGTW